MREVGEGVEGEGVEGEGIFLSKNNSVVEAHVGGDASLHCWVNRGSDFGTVSPDCTAYMSHVKWAAEYGDNNINEDQNL